jgi:sodium/potassium-transporting ATPase subunit alpha
MFVTDCGISTTTFAPKSARDDMVAKSKASGVHQLRAMTGLCNAGQFNAASMKLPLHQRQIYGDATDQAILRLSESLGSVAELRQMWKKTFELAFNSKNKFMIGVFSLAEPNGLEVAVSAAEESQWKQEKMSVSIFEMRTL